MNEDMFRIGVITSTHGLKGEVKVFPTTDDPARFKKLKKMLYSYKKWRCTSGEKIMQVL
jgi:16S rRNA processing protein RimM